MEESYNKGFVNSFFRYLVLAYNRKHKDSDVMKEQLRSLEKRIIELKKKGHSPARLGLLQKRIENLKLKTTFS